MPSALLHVILVGLPLLAAQYGEPSLGLCVCVAYAYGSWLRVCAWRAAIPAHARILAFAGLAAVWAWFWWVDLRHALFQYVTALVPGFALLFGVACRSWRGATTGACAGVTTILILMMERAAPHGCGGSPTSEAFGLTMLATGVFVLFGSPWMVSSSERGRDET